MHNEYKNTDVNAQIIRIPTNGNGNKGEFIDLIRSKVSNLSESFKLYIHMDIYEIS